MNDSEFDAKFLCEMMRQNFFPMTMGVCGGCSTDHPIMGVVRDVSYDGVEFTANDIVKLPIHFSLN